MSSHILPELSRVCDSVAIMNQGRVLAAGKLNELYEKYSAGTIRVSADKPEELASEIKTLAYVRKVEVDVRGILVQIQGQDENSFYEDVSRLAKKVNTKIQGIETGSASI